MPTPWSLVIKSPSVVAVSRIGGLHPLLRLSLDAQRHGASSIVVDGANEEQSAALRDARLRIPVLDRVPENSVCVEIPANWVVHQKVFAELSLVTRAAGETVAIPKDFCPNVPFSFPAVVVTDRISARRAEKYLFRSLRKPEDGWTSRWFNRYISLAISRWLAKTPIRPNQLSLVILAIGLYGAWLASQGSYTTMLIGATLFQLQSILDGCDGELSRITYRGSLLGEWLDTVGDDVTNYSFFLGASLGLFKSHASPIYLYVGGIMLLSGFIGSGLEYRYLVRIGSGDLLKYPLSQATSKREGKFGMIAPLFKRDTFVLLTWVAALFSVVGAALVVFAVGAVGVLASVISTEIRMAKERKGSQTS
jgi:phosphatidylglycerophosphate synthase